MGDDEIPIPDEGAVFTLGRSRFADNSPNKFWIKGDPIRSVACGDDHSAVLTKSGRVFTFGSNDYGQLGHGNTKSYSKPSSIKSLKGKRVSLVACGRSHTLVALEGGGCLGFGLNGDGQLGCGDSESRSSPSPIPQLYQVELVCVAGGAAHSLALNAAGTAFSWGGNREGQLGLGSVSDDATSPQPLVLPEPLAAVAAGYYHSAFLTRSGSVLTCGENGGGRLGLGEGAGEGAGDVVATPTLVQDLPPGERIVAVSCGWAHTAFVSELGRLYTCGQGSEGQLGLGDAVQSSAVPVRVPIDANIVSVFAGYDHTVAISSAGSLFMFGKNAHGKLGLDGETEKLSTPLQPPSLAMLTASEVGVGGSHTVILATLGGGEEEALSAKGQLNRQQSLARERRRLQRTASQEPPKSSEHAEAKIDSESDSDSDKNAPGTSQQIARDISGSAVTSHGRPQLPPLAFSSPATMLIGERPVYDRLPALADAINEDPEREQEAEALEQVEASSSPVEPALEKVAADGEADKENEAAGRRRSDGLKDAKQRFKNMFSRGKKKDELRADDDAAAQADGDGPAPKDEENQGKDHDDAPTSAEKEEMDGEEPKSKNWKPGSAGSQKSQTKEESKASLVKPNKKSSTCNIL